MQQRGCLGAYVGEGCEGRERSGRARSVEKQTMRGRGGSGSVPRSKPDPAAEQSSGGTP
ncbi:MAG: hypothetical protein NZM35_05465 [Chitinophagales bacterium]|nr:hypothetical protein [Chitinophagales bacterium]MDW8417901.1 hypothetical protein [Chitinophagales bacterium]